MSLSLKALVSAGMDEAANNDASNVILLFRAILMRRAFAQLQKNLLRLGQSHANAAGAREREHYEGCGEHKSWGKLSQ